MALLEEQEIRAIYRQGEDAVVSLIQSLCAEIEALKADFQRLEAQTNKNSHNSSKPPSSDGLSKRRTKSLRKKSRKKRGGQKGHKGQTLSMVEEPDHKLLHVVEACEHCACDLKDVGVVDIEKRQIFDIPPLKLEVTEHQVEVKKCPDCDTYTKGLFPQGVTQPAQYGNRVKALACYLNQYHFIPLERTCEIFEDVFEHRPSDGTIFQATACLFDHLEPVEAHIKQGLTNADVLHVDETSLSVSGKKYWVHVASTSHLTHYGLQEKRGSQATDAIGILPSYEGRVLHDHWRPYFKYEDCDHALCNAHHLRELKFITEQYQQGWAGDMTTLLMDIKQAVEKTCEQIPHLSTRKIKTFEKRYDQILIQGFKDNPTQKQKAGTKKKRGRPKQSPPQNLLDRLKLYKEEVLAFMYDFRVPFDNNQAERDIRMVKVKQKISGCFRSVEGADIFCRIRGYISTAKKNAIHVIDAIQQAFNNTPFIPPLFHHSGQTPMQILAD